MRMLRYALLVCLCLISVEATKIRVYNSTYYEPSLDYPGELDFDQYLISPDTFDGTFLVAQWKDIIDDKPSFPTLMHVKLTLHNDKNESVPEECHLKLSVPGRENATEWDVSQLRRLSKYRFAISWYGRVESGILTNMYVLDLDKCHGWIDTFDDRQDLSGQTFVVPLNHTHYDMFVNQESNLCSYERGGSKCLPINYIKLESRSSSNSLIFEYDWSTFRADRLSNKNIVVRGFDRSFKKYKAYVINHKSYIKKKSYESDYLDYKFAFASTGLSACWIRGTSHHDFVHCQIDSVERPIVDTWVDFDEPIAIMDVRASGEREIMLITKRWECKDERDCWGLRAARIGVSEDGESYVEHKDFVLPCTGNEQERLVIYEAKHGGVRFGCKQGLGFRFGFKRIF